MEKSNIRDFSKLRISDGRIDYRIRDQSGEFVDMSCPDTFDNRLFISWLQIHDGYSKARED